MKFFKYCDACAIQLKLPEVAARRKGDCENCDSKNVVVNFGDAKDKPKKKRKPAAKKKATPKKKAAAKKPASKAKPKTAAKAKAKKKGSSKK